MGDHYSVRCEQVVGLREEAGIVRRAEMLDQADADDPVERLADCPTRCGPSSPNIATSKERIRNGAQPGSGFP